MHLKRCISIFLCLFSANGAVADMLTDQFPNPVDEVVCDQIPVLERGKYEKCAFAYLEFELDPFVAELEARREQRRIAQQARLWEWFTAPPVAASCEELPELERAKFVFQCDLQQSSAGTLSYLDLNLQRLQTSRDSLARRITALQNEFTELQARQDRVDSAPSAVLAAPELGAVLTRFQSVADQATTMERLASELAQRPDLGKIDKITLVSAPVGINLTDWQDASVVIGQIDRSGVLVAMINAAWTNPQSVLLVHPQLGLVAALKSEFNAE
ncbi:hypothetical protein [Algirhabdus cladophorae]|uniref:hypothetical protein n=1 Tax=Algirhabdus cladophorae TaxID=3377108 RepID=UPI003B846BBB